MARPSLRQATALILSMHPNLIMDCDELTYMASSGLRIIQKTMRSVMMKHGTFKMVNVSPEIYKVLNMTGFTKFMAVEQKQ